MRLIHVEVYHGGGLGMKVPVRLGPETAICGNTHLVVAPGRERQEAGREKERGGGGGREDVVL